MKQFTRTELLLGEEGMSKLENSKVLIFGVGGVGGYVVEALARSAIGHLALVDSDVVDITNINRQIIATLDVVGKPKVDVFRERIKAISPDTSVETHQVFYLPAANLSREAQTSNIISLECMSTTVNADYFDFKAFDYVVDAIDTVAAKLDIIERCSKCGTPIISAMGCGNRLDPSKLVITDIFKTENDPLAKVIRKGLRDRGIKKLKVVASTELPTKPVALNKDTTDGTNGIDITNGTDGNDTPDGNNGNDTTDGNKNLNETSGASSTPGKRSVPGSTAFVPPAAGLLIASQVVRDILDR